MRNGGWWSAYGALSVVLVGVPGCLESSSGTAGDTAQPTDAYDSQDTFVCPSWAVGVDGEVQSADYVPWRVAVAADGVYFSGEWVGGGRAEILRLDPATGVAGAASSEAGSAVLIDARQGAFLYLAVDADGGNARLVYRSGAEQRVLTDQDAGERVRIDYGPTESRHVVRAGMAAWRSHDYDGSGRAVRARVRALYAGEVRTLWERSGDGTLPVPPWPFVDEDYGIYWADPGPPADTGWHIRVLAGSEVSEGPPVGEQVRELVPTSSAIVWVGPSGLWSSFGNDAPTLLVPGSCGALDGDGRANAVALCEPPTTGAPARWWSPYGGSSADLVVYAGGAVKTLAAGGGLRLTPRIDGEVVAWLAFPELSDGCSTRGPGQVTVAPVSALENSAGIAEVGIGCYCCNALWSDQALSVRDGLIAWNYGTPISSDSYPESFGHLGWARVSQRCP